MLTQTWSIWILTYPIFTTFSPHLTLAVVRSPPTSLPQTLGVTRVRPFHAWRKQTGCVATEFPELPGRLGGKVQSIHILDWRLQFPARSGLSLLQCTLLSPQVLPQSSLWGKFGGHFLKYEDIIRSHFSKSPQSKPPLSHVPERQNSGHERMDLGCTTWVNRVSYCSHTSFPSRKILYYRRFSPQKTSPCECKLLWKIQLCWKIA